MVSFSVSAFFSCWAWTCSYRLLVEKMVIQRHCQGIFHGRESEEESMGFEQWDCLYKNPRALLYAVGGWKLFSVRKSIHSEPGIFISLLQCHCSEKKRKEPSILAHFQTYSSELLSELVWMVTHPWTTKGNLGTDRSQNIQKKAFNTIFMKYAR